MVGWGFLFLLVVIILGWRERRRNYRKFSELNTRLAQVEELLLEVCALVEEKIVPGELPPLQPEPAVPEKPAEKTEPDQPGRRKEPEKPNADEVGAPGTTALRVVSKPVEETAPPSPTVASRKEQPGLTGEQPAPPEQPDSPPKMPAKKGRKPATDKKTKTVNVQKLPPWNQQIIELWQKGLSVQEIARQIGKGQGEVQLILDLYGNERVQN